MFRKAQIRLGMANIKTVPNLDVETRWNPTFHIVCKYYLLRYVFECLWNDASAADMFWTSKISAYEWKVFNSVSSLPPYTCGRSH